MNEISCIFCGIESNYVVIEENGYKGKKCLQCGLIYISPRPPLDEIENLYEHDAANLSAESHISADFSKRLYARQHLRVIRSFIQSGELLEIGAGAGYFLDEAHKAGFSPYGLEINPFQAHYIRNKFKIPCEESTLNTAIFEGKKFDLVYLCDVVSHFFDPISDFTKINTLMKGESFLIFETGNLGEVDKMYFKYFQKFQYPDHLFFFSTDNLIDLLRKTGFKFVKIYRYSILPELMIIKTLSGIRSIIQKHIFKPNRSELNLSYNDSVDIQSVANSKLSNAKSIVKKRIKNAYQYLHYIVRYKIGRIVPKAHRPQTVIVVARKSTESHLSDKS